MKRTLVIALLLGMAAPAYAAIGDYAEFIPDRDWSNAAGSGDLANGGAYECCRAYKWRWQEGLLMDWDTQAMLDWMGANPPGEGEKYKFTLDLCAVSYSNWMIANRSNPGQPVRLEVRTLNLGNGTNWAEGDATGPGCAPGGGNLQWSPGTMAACNAYAQLSWTMVGYLPTPDVDNAVPWTAHEGTVFTSFQNSDPLMFRNINGLYDKNQNGSIDPDEQAAKENFYMVIPTDEPLFAEATHVTAELQYDPDHPSSWYPCPVVNDLLYNADNQGLIMGQMQAWQQNRDTGEWYWERGYWSENPLNPGEWIWGWYAEEPVGSGNWVAYPQTGPFEWGQNGCFVTKDKDNEVQKPRIIIEIAAADEPLPWPGDAQPDGKVDGGDYTIWADNYGKTDAPVWSAGGWTVGNFTEDANVDGGDYTVWADNYGYGTGGAPVPEPATLLALAAGAAAVICRRRRS